LPQPIRDLADKNFALLKLDQNHPSLSFKKVGAELWSARVGIRYRALALEQDGDFVWIWIGSHAEYDRLIK
jgi:hypothetical protein